MAEIAVVVGQKVAEDTAMTVVQLLTRQAGYLINYGDNVKELGDSNKKLEEKKDEARQFIKHAEQNFNEVVPSVVRWRAEAEELNNQVVAFLNKEAEVRNNICQTPWSRYSMGRKAFKMAECVNAKLREAPTFDRLAYDVAPPNTGSTFNLGSIKDYDSRLLLMDEVLKALEDATLSILGICGIGGVGKTTMVKQLVKHVEARKLFKVAITTVSQKRDLEKMQSDIVSCLGLKFGEGETKQNKRSKLHQKIVESNERILLVLDDVWPEFDFENFEAIGIPSQSQKCKILLTSRTATTCNSLRSQRNFRIDTLSKEEGFDLFRKMAGDPTDGDLVKLAEGIADECGGIPIAIVTVANALRNKPNKASWESVLQQLKNKKIGRISKMEENVYYPIELSYDLLETKEAKSCFLLCSLFPEDFHIPIEQLVIYGMGLGFLGEIEDVQQTRIDMQCFVDQLKDSFLLLDGDQIYNDDVDDFDDCVKMHDVVRDVAISIASKEKRSYMGLRDAIMKQWPRVDCAGISLECEEMKAYPMGLEYPNLQVLLLEYMYSQFLPDNFFEGMKELKVLSLNNLGSLPESLGLLKNLTTLCLLNFGGEDISIVGTLSNIMVLRIGGLEVTTLPENLANLENLRIFDIRGLESLKYIPRGILAKLVKLEELYVCGSFAEWDHKNNASLSELESCPITTLEVCVAKTSQFPSIDTEQISRFHISVGYRVECEIVRGSMNKIEFGGCAMSMGFSKRSREIEALLRRTEILKLTEVDDFQPIINKHQGDGFPQLKILKIMYSPLEHLVDTNSKNLQLLRRGVTNLPCFSNLRDIDLYKVDKLENMFPLSMAKELKQLESISIFSCHDLRAIFCRKEVDDENVTDTEIEFPKLTQIVLTGVPKLLGFWVDMEIKEDGSLPCQEQGSASEIEQFQSNLPAFFPSYWLRFSSLEKLCLTACKSLKVAFPACVAQQLRQLKYLSVSECVMEHIVGKPKEEYKGTIISLFPMLISLKHESMPELSSFSVEMQELMVENCNKMEGSLMEGSCVGNSMAQYSSMFTSKVIGGAQFEDLTLDNCGKLQVIFSLQESNNACGVFNSLKTLELRMLSNLQHIWVMKIPPKISSFQNLRKISVYNCAKLTCVFSPHMVKVLGNLEDLSIGNCDRMTTIVAAEEEEQVFEIEFSKLQSLNLDLLPELRSFTGGASYTLKFPLLEDLILFDICLPTFCNGSLSTPKLKEVQLGHEFNDPKPYSLRGDLNATLKDLEGKMLAILEGRESEPDDYLFEETEDESNELLLTFEEIEIEEESDSICD